jgi:PAS domain S-box-containing protein
VYDTGSLTLLSRLAIRYAGAAQVLFSLQEPPMTRVWSYRPQLLHLGLFFGAYVLGCGFAQALAIVPGTGISIWPSSGLFIATLILAPKQSWPWWVLVGCLGELFGNVLWFHSPLPAAVLIYAGNALEATVGAWLVNRALGRPARLETLREVLVFVVLGAGVAPVVSATVGSATLAWFGIFSQTFFGAWPLWWIGDATGVLIVAPLALVVIQNWNGKAELTAARWIEACAVGLILLGVAALSLGGYLPFAYIIMPPLLWAAVRFEFKGAAVTLVLLALITAIFTISGTSQFAGNAENQRHNQIMLQLFLAISAFSALVVAAISRQHQLALLTLRQSVEALRDRERELSQLVDALPVHIWSWTPAGELDYVNKRSLEDLGLSKANFEDTIQVAQKLVHPEDAPEVLRASASCLKTGDAFMMRYRRRWKDGNYRWIEARAQPLRDQDGAIVHWYQVSIDIDDQVQAEEALKSSKRQLEQMIDAMPFNILSFAASGEMTYTSKRYLDDVGSPTADIKDFDALARDVAHPDDFPTMSQRASDDFATGQPFVNRFRRRNKQGVYRWIEARAQPLRDADGTIVQWYIASIDIEDEMRAQAALRERERFLWQLVETLPAMIDCAAPNGEPVYRSQQLREFLGYEAEELDGKAKSRLNGTLDARVHPDDIAGVKEQYAHCLATGEPYLRKHRLRRFDGEYIWVETRAAPMRKDDGTIVQWNVICLDIDGEVRMQEELRLAQERLARASQAASFAELSASIAHEVNQPLAAIVANSHACYRWLSAEPVNVARAKITTERVIRDANSAAEVVGRVRALFKQSVENRISLSLSGVITEACNLVAGEALRRRIRIDIDVEGKLPPITVDRIQIQQVLVNLMRNGMEAMEAVAGEKALDVHAHRVGSEVQTEIGDRGNGIEFPDQIFEPFFTTKENGMGMGLAICRSIVEAHGGRLWAEKNEPHGARFIFTLPIVGKAAP